MDRNFTEREKNQDFFLTVEFQKNLSACFVLNQVFQLVWKKYRTSFNSYNKYRILFNLLLTCIFYIHVHFIYLHCGSSCRLNFA